MRERERERERERKEEEEREEAPPHHSTASSGASSSSSPSWPLLSLRSSFRVSMRLMARILEGPRGAIGKGRGKRERAVNEEESRVNVFFLCLTAKPLSKLFSSFHLSRFPSVPLRSTTLLLVKAARRRGRSAAAWRCCSRCVCLVSPEQRSSFSNRCHQKRRRRLDLSSFSLFLPPLSRSDDNLL